jgi:general secretion pathway protein C
MTSAALLVLFAQVADAPAAAVVGVVVSRKPELSSAVIQSDGRARVVGVGDSIAGSRVLEISAAGVTLDGAGGRVLLRLRGEVASALPMSAPPSGLRDPLPAEPPPALEPAVKTLQRRDVDARLSSEIPRILAETTMFPVTENGRVIGFTLTRLPEGTLLSDVGLRPGDVLLQLNDVSIDSLATLISLWPRLQGAPQLRAEVLRGGQPVSLVVNIK